MRSGYYYFIATLPMITFESKLPFSMEEFLNDCQRLLSEKDYAVIEHVLNDKPELAQTGNEVVNKWRQFATCLRFELAWYRAEKFHKESLDLFRGERFCHPEIVGVVETALAARNLLETEKIIDRAKWKFLEDLGTPYQFAFENIVVYGLQLKILERYHSINSGEGQKQLENYQAVTV